MQAYRWSVKLKLGLIVFAVLIAVASLWYTSRLVNRLRGREQTMIELWADAQMQQARMAQAQIQAGSHQQSLSALQVYLQERPLPENRQKRYRAAVEWAQSMPPSGESVTDKILTSGPFLSIPAIITDSSSQQPVIWRGVSVSDSIRELPAEDSARAMRRLRRLQAEMDEAHTPIPIELSSGAPGSPRLKQRVHYAESGLIKELRIFPYVQLLFVGLFILVGYVGFSYVRRSEQSSLWVGMAREAAHQLGTPISSLMGWTELLKSNTLSEEQRGEALREIESDIHRLQRVAGRFSDIGSLPKLEEQPVAPIVDRTIDYLRRRLPRRAQDVQLTADVPPGLRAPLNAELFEWVVENLLKNALDAIDEREGTIEVRARRVGEEIHLEVEDTGCGIDRRQWKNVFRPGYSTKKRGWGLGLSLAQRVVEDYHGGTLSIAGSKPGEGTTFRIELPAVGSAPSKKSLTGKLAEAV